MWLKEIPKTVVRSLKFENLKQQHGLYSDDHRLLRCKGRLKNASIPFNAKHPILLPADHHLTVLIIDNCRKRTLHNSVKETLTELTSRFWVSKGRQAVRRVIIEVRKLQENRSQALCHSTRCNMTSIPRRREPCTYKYWNDFAVPLFVTSGEDKEQSNFQKVYLALFSCGSTRAVHLELVPDHSSETKILK